MRSVAVGVLVAFIMPLAVAAADNPLLGTWEISDAIPAPWTSTNDRLTLVARGQKRLHAQVTFKPKLVVAKEAGFGCKKATYDVGMVPPDALFQAGLPEPKERFAKTLGFTTADVPSVDLKCSSGLFSYHFKDENTALVSLDNVIYTLKRH